MRGGEKFLPLTNTCMCTRGDEIEKNKGSKKLPSPFQNFDQNIECIEIH